LRHDCDAHTSWIGPASSGSLFVMAAARSFTNRQSKSARGETLQRGATLMGEKLTDGETERQTRASRRSALVRTSNHCPATHHGMNAVATCCTNAFTFAECLRSGGLTR
jgi:hypothetical protein